MWECSPVSRVPQMPGARRISPHTVPGGPMRASRLFMAAGLAMIVAIGSAAILSAQSKTDEDYDKLMKAVGAANGTIAKATDAATIAAEAKKLQALFKDAQQFWTARQNKEAADY